MAPNLTHQPAPSKALPTAPASPCMWAKELTTLQSGLQNYLVVLITGTYFFIVNWRLLSLSSLLCLTPALGCHQDIVILLLQGTVSQGVEDTFKIYLVISTKAKKG